MLYQKVIQKLPFNDRVARSLGHLCGRRITAQVNHFRMKLDLQETIQRQMFLGEYEPAQTAWFRECLSFGDTVVDVGASFGYYTTLAATLVGHTGRVFAFEPSPTAGAVLGDAVASSPHITLTKAALGRGKGTARLFMPTTAFLHSPSILESDPGFQPIEIPILRLDEFKPLGNAVIKLVKIDVEGYEPDVLAGMAELIREKRVENVMCEFNSGWLKRNGVTPKQLLQQFRDCGFQVHKQTPLMANLPGHEGEVFDLQDIWLTLS